jgi:DNA-binding transcriptional MerR regulator
VVDTIEKTYTTSQVAQIIGIHPNTVRMYEEAELISKPLRKENGYRVFTDIHLDQFKLARTAFQIEVLQNGLRKKIISVVKESALGHFDEALRLTNEYIQMTQKEIENANEAVTITRELMKAQLETDPVTLKRKDVSMQLRISMDTIRNWEMNGLIKVKRKANGYRAYTEEEIRKIKIIRSLRCANYSLSAILRMLNALSRDSDINIERVLNTPQDEEDIVSVCDKLIVSLNDAKSNAQKMITLLNVMQNKCYTISPT